MLILNTELLQYKVDFEHSTTSIQFWYWPLWYIIAFILWQHQYLCLLSFQCVYLLLLCVSLAALRRVLISAILCDRRILVCECCDSMRAWRRGRARLARRDILPCGLLLLCFCRCTHCSSVRYFCSWFFLYGLFAGASLYGLFAAAFGRRPFFSGA